LFYTNANLKYREEYDESQSSHELPQQGNWNLTKIDIFHSLLIIEEVTVQLA